MLKALIKKQFLEINKGLLQNKKTGKARSKSTIFLIVLLYAVLFFGISYGIYSLCDAVFEDLEVINWLYFGIFSFLAVVFGVFGSVFATYASIYLARDNDLLLSMPIKVKTILNVRLIGVYLMGLLYSSIIMVPVLLAYFVNCSQTALSVLTSLLLYVLVTLIVMALSCLFGFIVAKISSKLKNKSFITVILALCLIAVYFWLQDKIAEVMEEMLIDGSLFAEQVKSYAYPIYALGKVAEGDWVFVGAVSGITIFVNIIIYLVLSSSFIKLTTMKSGTKKVKYNDKSIKVKSAKKALLAREFKRYLSSAAYILNCSFGTLIMTLFAIYLFIDSSLIALLGNIVFNGVVEQFIPYLTCFILFMLSSNSLTAPSISLEGKNVWIAQTLPVKSWDILKSKIYLHLILTLPPVILLAVSCIIPLEIDIIYILLFFAICLVSTVLNAEFGLFLNLKIVNLKWMSEAIAVKRGANMFLAIFTPMTLSVVGVILYSKIQIASWIFLTSLLVIEIVLLSSLHIFLKKKGTKIFESL